MTRKRNRTAVFQAPFTAPERKKRTSEGAEEASLKGGRPAPFVHKNVGKAETSDKKERHNSTVFVGDLSPETTVCEVKSRFESFGSIARVKIADESGHGFITFRAKESAETAIRAATDPYGIRVRNKRVFLGDRLSTRHNNFHTCTNFFLNNEFPTGLNCYQPSSVYQKLTSCWCQVTVSWASDAVHQWKMGIGCLNRGQDVLTEKLPSKIPHGREGRGGNREAVLVAAVAAAGSRGKNEKADALYQGREVVAYDDLL